MKTDFALPFLNPTEILTVATFHIRRIAAMTIRTDPERLPDALRCRQWSCISFAYECFGKDPCVDDAIVCVADRIRLVTGCPVSQVSMITHYSRALRSLQIALYEPADHNPQDILAATQLLAVYEMLDSLDNDGWSKHVAGAETIIQLNTSITPAKLKQWDIRGCGCALPMFSDALLKGNTTFFRYYPWRELIWAISTKYDDKRPLVYDLMECLTLIPDILLDMDEVSDADTISLDLEFALLDRAHDLKTRMKVALLGSALYEECNQQNTLSFDMFGTCLSALVSLDRIISALCPVQLQLRSSAEDATGELCAQLLQLELGASNSRKDEQILAAFQLAGGPDMSAIQKKDG